MNYAQIRPFDVANGEGIRVTIFLTGCNFNCKGCFNKEYQDFNHGKVWKEETTREVITYLKNENTVGLTLLGGEPMEHAKELLPIIKEIRTYMREEQDIWIYSGYTLEQIKRDKEKLDLLLECDIIVDGLYKEELKDLTLRFRGSSNQRIINIKEGI